MENCIINNKYIIQKCIGTGKFGTVFRGIYKKTNEHIAIKFEDNTAPFNILKHEANILNMLASHNCRFVPPVYWYGIYNDMKAFIMPYYTCSLDQYIKIKQLSNGQLNNIITKMIEVIESIHEHGVIHRDLKPQNFMVKSGEIYLIDFGLSTFYIDSNSVHILDKQNDCIIGTPKYISYNIHCGNTPSRRDDLISIGYLYIYLLRIELPWANISIENNNNHNGVECMFPNEIHTSNVKNIRRRELKSWDYLQHLCHNINEQIYEYLRVCYLFEYNELPNYTHLIDIYNI